MNAETDSRIIEAFKEGKVKGVLEPGIKPFHLITSISHIFLFPKSVYKLYRRDNDVFNKRFFDLADENFRLEFYRKDFFCNHYFSKDIYTDLLGVRVNNEIILGPKGEENYDLVIQMNRIDEKNNLTVLLKQGSLAEKDLRIIGYETTKLIAEYTEKPRTGKNYYEILKDFIVGLRDLAYMVDDYIPKADTNSVAKIMDDYVEKNRKELEKLTEKDFILTVDNHSDNVFYAKGKLSFIDLYLPREDWAIVEPLYAIGRLYTDVVVFLGKKYAEALLQGYKDYYGIDEIDRGRLDFYQIFNATLRAPYFFMAHRDSGSCVKKEEGEAYWEFLRMRIPRLSKLKVE